MNFKKWVKSIQTAGYSGARTVLETGTYMDQPDKGPKMESFGQSRCFLGFGHWFLSMLL